MFEDNTSCKIGRILVEKRNSDDLYEVAMGLYGLYVNSNKKDTLSGEMAINVAIQGYFMNDKNMKHFGKVILLCLNEGIDYPDCSAEDSRKMYYVFLEKLSGQVPELAYQLGKAYERGIGSFIPQNEYIASEWYEKAANAGDEDAQFSLGNLYFEGMGVDVDYSWTLYWWRKAAEKNHVSAQYNLGIFYAGILSGAPHYTYRDDSKATYWLQKAAENGHEEARDVLKSYFQYNSITRTWKRR